MNRFLRDDERDELVLKRKKKKEKNREKRGRFVFSLFLFEFARETAREHCYMCLYIFLDYARGTSVYSFSSVAAVIVKITNWGPSVQGDPFKRTYPTLFLYAP